MKKYNIIELIKEIKESSTMERVDISSLCDYNGGQYLCDILSEINDSNIDIYYSDLFEWAKDNFSYINEAKQEFGTSEDITKEIQQGQYLQNQEEIYNNLDDMLSIYIYNILKENNIEELTEEQNDIIYDLVESMKDNDKLYDNDEIISEIINNEEEQEV